MNFISKISIAFVVLLLSATACEKDNDSTEPEVVERGIYVPKEFADPNNSGNTWSYARSQQSEHFIVFWGAGYSTRHPSSTDVPELYRVDIDQLLSNVEEYYDLNVNKLKFAEVGSGKSNLDKYKMIILLYYTTDFVGAGYGFDDVIGAIWLSPNPIRAGGSVIAHEIGHSFQYQVYCDLKGTAGFRQNLPGSSMNAFWEQTAQWQAFQSYPKEAFSTGQFRVYTQNYHKHILHETQRYASYFIHYYWADKHGLDMIARIWREAQQSEDPVQAYMRLTNITVEQLNDEIYDGAKKFVTWDLDAIRTNGADYIGKHTYGFTAEADGFYRVSYDKCPQTTGYNVLPLALPAAGTEVTVDFKGVPNTSGFNTVDATTAGWRYGYVALLNNGTRVYGDMAKGTQNNVSFTVPENCSKLWFVVTGAPTAYISTGSEGQYLYEVKFTNTKIIGY